MLRAIEARRFALAQHLERCVIGMAFADGIRLGARAAFASIPSNYNA